MKLIYCNLYAFDAMFFVLTTSALSIRIVYIIRSIKNNFFQLQMIVVNVKD